MEGSREVIEVPLSSGKVHGVIHWHLSESGAEFGGCPDVSSRRDRQSERCQVIKSKEKWFDFNRVGAHET